MKVPLRWLADYVPHGLDAAELARRLTVAGLEVAAFRSFGLPVPEGLKVRQDEPGPVWDRDKYLVARVDAVLKHPDADKLKLPQVDFGRRMQLVTGAPNLSVGDAGQKVVVGLAGCVFWDGHVTPKKLSTLVPKPVRGIASEGMVMSALELGINDEHEGIILLDHDAPVGVPLMDHLGDIALEIDVLPNMARCLSMVGIAREVAAFTGKKLVPPPLPAAPAGPTLAGRVHVRIDDPALCRRYSCALIEGVSHRPAPTWMQYRLWYAGQRPIDAVVDTTNYVMLEYGQPLHAFDFDKLKERAGGKAPTIIVRPGRAGESLILLREGSKKPEDRKPTALTPGMLVIADEAGPIALAGVMGGLETEVTAATRNILLESASFDAVSIRKTARALDLPSEASMRFSKGIHPEMVPLALHRAADLMRQLAGGTVAQGVVEQYPAPIPPRTIELKRSEIVRVLGQDIPLDQAARTLSALEFKTEVAGDALRATVPPHRLDIQDGPADLIEDLARLRGYDALPATLLKEPLPAQAGNPALDFEERLRDVLAGAGLQEAICYALTTPEKEAPLGEGQADYVRLANPISSERTVMRRSLLPGLLEAAERNLKSFDAVRLFEIGSVYLPLQGRPLPHEPRRVGIVMAGRRVAESWADPGSAPKGAMDFFDLKGVVEALVADLRVEGADFVADGRMPFHPGKCAVLKRGARSCDIHGALGELHPKVAAAFGLGGRAVLAAEFDIEGLRSRVGARFSYAPVPRFPAALRDVAVIVPEEMPAETVERAIRDGGGVLLAEVRLFDVYRGESIPPGTKSLAYALSYQAGDRTLTDKEVDKAHKAIEGRLRHVLKAQIRGQDVQ
ncbi:MAG: phenylalanine--tRNA ligase subunit beta [Gemmataceae bacterium]|nr:phenylalanine--tRNA ligase subunit beta [Gemmataceae bacterium]